MGRERNLKEKFFLAKKLIEKSKKILILSHKAPDGDALSSTLAMHYFLKRKNKESHPFLLNPPKYLSFLESYDEIERKSKKIRKINFDLILLLDYAGKDRIEIPAKFEIDEKKCITFDHHPEDFHIGKVKIVEEKFASTTELLYEFFLFLKEEITPPLATMLLCGIITDTAGGRRLPQESSKKVAELILKGADFKKILEKYYSFSLEQGKLLGKLLSRIKTQKNIGVLYSYFLLSEIKKAKDFSLLEPPIFSDFLTQIEGYDIYLFLCEQKKGKVKVSLRSKKTDVSKIAKKFGGGGHKKASGFRKKGSLKEVLKQVLKEIEKQKFQLQ